VVIIATILNVDRLTFLLNGMEWNNVFVNSISFHVSISYKNELFPYTSKTFGRICFFLVLVQIRRIYYMLHIASYHYHPLAKNIYFNMMWPWHINMCCLIKLYVDMLTLFKRLLTKEHMSMQKVRLRRSFCIQHVETTTMEWSLYYA